jgi:hypothetical protein
MDESKWLGLQGLAIPPEVTVLDNVMKILMEGLCQFTPMNPDAEPNEWEIAAVNKFHCHFVHADDILLVGTRTNESP